MESVHEEWPVKNTFIDMPTESEFFECSPFRRFCSEPARGCAAHEDLQQDAMAPTIPKRTCKTQKHTIDTMPTMTLDSVQSLSVDALESLPDCEEWFSADLGGSQPCGCKELRLASPSVPLQKVPNSIRNRSKPKNKQSMKALEPTKALEHGQPSSVVPSHGVTTLMLGNIPYKLSQEGLAQAIDELGFAGTYDLIYLPRGSGNHVGYGFINFRSPEEASRFSYVITSFKSSTAPKWGKVRVVVAKTQGFAETFASIQAGTNFRKRSHHPFIIHPTP